MTSNVSLAERNCVSLPSGTPALMPEAAGRLLAELPGWQIENNRLRKAYRFEDFASALRFVDRVGAMADEQDHHPDVHLGWGRAEIELWTHSVGGLSDNDFIFAAKTENLAKGAPGRRT